jgi:hypothetical protein
MRFYLFWGFIATEVVLFGKLGENKVCGKGNQSHYENSAE